MARGLEKPRTEHTHYLYWETRRAMPTAPIYQVKAEFFKALGHPARIRVLEVLREGERPVSELIPEVGIESSHLSQQLGIMRRANLVQARKDGSIVVYSVANPMLFELLDVAKAILTSSLADTRDLLAELESAAEPRSLLPRS
jgi:ArsR family transcriptional regulator